MKARIKYSFTFVAICGAVVLLWLYELNSIPTLSNIREYRILYKYQTKQSAFTRQIDGYNLSLETAIARHTLTRDVQELWNFLAAQLQLHSGYRIQRLATIEDMIYSLHEYRRVLLYDVALYKTRLENETSVTATPLMRILPQFNTTIGRQFDYILHEMNQARNRSRKLPSHLTNVNKEKLRHLNINVQSLLRRMNILADQEAKSRDLGDKIQQRIHKLQNPLDCSSARKLLCGVCSRLRRCGIGCTLFYVGLCQVTAYLSNRTMILDCSGWCYSRRGWEAAFKPMTNCTKEHIKDDYKSIPELKTESHLTRLFNQTVETVKIVMPVLNRNIHIFPPAVPRDIFNKILRFNSDPPSWWLGQFKKWAMRLKDEVARDVKEHIRRHNVSGTVVGLHVRRTDKRKEASYHSLDEYMVHAAEWYDAYELTNPTVQRKIYLATDESRLIEEATKRYPKYEFIYDRNITSSATRYNEQSLIGTLKDIYSLIRCDFVVCTFSSTMCRLVYELAQAQYGDAQRFRSIDTTYFVPGRLPVNGRVTHDHNATRKSETDIHKGNVVKFLENHWDGYAVISDSSKNKTGLIPAFKIDEIFQTYDYSSNIKP